MRARMCVCVRVGGGGGGGGFLGKRMRAIWREVQRCRTGTVWFATESRERFRLVVRARPMSTCQCLSRPRVCVVSFTIGFGSEHNVDLLMDLAKLGEGGKYHFLNRFGR